MYRAPFCRSMSSFVALRGLTAHGNPVEEGTGYRQMVITTMPQLLNLDFTRITDKEKKEAKFIVERHGMFKAKKGKELL